MRAMAAMCFGEQAIPFDVVSDDLCADGAVTHDENTIADRGDLLEVARPYDDCGSGRGRTAQQVVEVTACSNVDTGSRINKNENLRPLI